MKHLKRYVVGFLSAILLVLLIAAGPAPPLGGNGDPEPCPCTWLSLYDTPNSYSGMADQVPNVNAAETDMEFSDTLYVEGTKVGVGIADPDATLHVYASATGDVYLAKVATSYSWGGAETDKLKSIGWQDSSSVTAAIGAAYDGAGSVDLIFHSMYDGGYKGVGDKVMIVKGNGDVGIGVDPSYTLHVDGDARVTGEAYFDDKVGIGTTTPSYELDVTGDARVGDDLVVDDNASVASELLVGLNVIVQNDVYVVHEVGIGTDTPEVPLDVYGTSVEGALVRAQTDAADYMAIYGRAGGDRGTGLVGLGAGYGVRGYGGDTNGVGVFGHGIDTDGVGVFGGSDAAGDSRGVWGQSTGVGVYGVSDDTGDNKWAGWFHQYVYAGYGLNVNYNAHAGRGKGNLVIGNYHVMPTDALENAAALYTASGELWAMDEDGNAQQLTPHDPETGEWIYVGTTHDGQYMRVRMEQLVAAIEKLTGESFTDILTAEEWEQQQKPHVAPPLPKPRPLPEPRTTSD